MHEHAPSHTAGTERRCDVAVIGGSAAGLAAALQLARQRRSVIVVDDDRPRNAPAAHMHSYLGYDGRPPSELVAAGREEVRRYGGEVIAGRAVQVTRTSDGDFHVELTGGHALLARRVLAATGLVDHLPDIEGLADHWGADVIHCPFCHGYEARDRRVVQIVTHPMGLHPARLFRQLTDRLTLVLHDGVAADDPALEPMRDAGVTVVAERARRVVSDADGRVVAVELADGSRLDADAIAVGPRFSVRTEPFAALGLKPAGHASGLGDVVETDGSGLTSVPGLYAAGNMTDPSQQVLHAAAAGSWVGSMIAFDVADEDIEAAARTSANEAAVTRSANEADWDHRYGDDRMWSGNPNGSFVAEVSGVSPGRALDVGAGEGGDAIWLAEQGWTVTASDISQRALDRVAAAANDRRLDVSCLRADANALDPFGGRTFDLVSAQYASIPRTPDDRAIQNLMDAVAPGGLLVVVGHDLAPMRSPIDPGTTSRPFDPDAYVRVDDVAAAVTASPEWDVEVHETRPRPPGAASASHHVDDLILRARRRAT